MSNIELSHKSNAQLATIDKILAWLFTNYNIDIKLGDLFWDEHSGMCYLVDVEFKSPTEQQRRNRIDSDWEKLDIYNIDLFFNYYKKEDNREYYERYKQELSSFIQHHHIYKIEAESEEDFDKDAELLADGLITMEDLLAQRFPQIENEQSTGLMIMNKDVLIDKKKQLVKQSQFAMSRVEAAKNLLESRKMQMMEMAGKMMKFIKKLNRLIYSIELYLGIKEELNQFGIGVPAPATDPICFRQRLLYMDVEIGDPCDDLKGIDFTDIDKFDEWLMKPNTYWGKLNYELLIPESKCVVIFKVREKDKEYSSNPWVNFNMNVANHLTYILIRNGENIYRIYADIIIGEKLFPDQEELTELVERMNGEFKPKNGEHIWNDDKEKAEDKIERYKLNMILLQGIIERTPCFPEHATTTSIFDPKGYEGKIKFIYDGTLNKQLPTNVPTFSEWQKQVNETIEEGSRVFVMGSLYNWNRYSIKSDAGRFFKVYYNEHNTPDKPGNGIFQVYLEKAVTKYSWGGNDKPRNVLYIKYNPGGETYRWVDDRDWDERGRKNRVSWLINKEDNFIFNWDFIKREQLKELEFYIYTRIGREKYLNYIPLLLRLYKEKQLEIEKEDSFLKLCLNQAGLSEDNFQIAIDAMDWWKLKNKWKRALTVDDKKALRMIVAKLKKEK
jgi:hypothetical protein